MRKWTVHGLALAAVMSWGAAYAQPETNDPLGIPPSPSDASSSEDSQSGQSSESGQAESTPEAAETPETPDATTPSEPAPPPGSSEEGAPGDQPADRFQPSDSDSGQAPSADAPDAPRSSTDRPPGATAPRLGEREMPRPDGAARGDAPRPDRQRPQNRQGGAAGPRTFQGDAQGGPSARGELSVGPPPDVEVGPNTQISPRVRAATEDLDIDDATRARYRWHLGEWWFQTDSGDWLYFRDGQWVAFDENEYQPPAEAYGGEAPMNGYAAPGTVQGSPSFGGSTPPPSVRSANGYYYRAPSYRPSPPRVIYRGTGYRYGGRYHDPYRGGYYQRRPAQPGFYNQPRYNRYPGRGGYGRGPINRGAYRGAVIGSEIGGQVGGHSGAIIGGAIGAEAAD